ncbi:MAG: hypothetical protein JWO88_3628 [Frankiales bacterium]|nr:hypothetical protein [Frankiales bacterium]
MPIKQKEVLSRGDFDQAVVHLRLSVSEIAKATSIPRTYLSEFRNGDRKLRPENLAKLRDYFEGQGIEFDDLPDDDSPPALQRPPIKSKEVRYVWPVAESINDGALQSAQALIEDNDARIAALLKQTVERDDDEFSEAARAALQEAGTLMAENYALLRMVRGWSALGLKASADGVESVRDVVLATFRQRLEEAGLIEPAAAPDKEREAA